MKNKKLFQKIVFIALIALILFSLVAPAIFSQTAPAPKQEKLLNGLKILMWPDAKADTVSVRIRIHAGAAFDPQGKEGVMQLLADNIFPDATSREFFAEDLGGGLEIVTNYDFIQVNASSRSADFLTMLETLATAVSSPVIDKETTAKLRHALSAKIALLEADPAHVADQAVANRLFGTFPYGRPQLGTAASVKKIDFADLIDARERFLTADNATIAVSGNFDRALGFRAIRRYFGSWLKSDKKVPSTFRQPDDPVAAVLNIASPKSDAAAIRFAVRGVAYGDKDAAASQIFSRILENRLRARAPVAHAGDVFVRNEIRTLPGIITIGMTSTKKMIGTANGKIEAGELLGKAISDPVTEAEFRAARAAWQSEWIKKDIASFWLDSDTFKTANAGADFRSVDNVTFAEVNAYAEKFRKLPMATVLLNAPASSS